MPFQSGVTIMTIRLKILLSAHLGLFFLLSIPNCCHAGTPTSDRIALEAGVKNEIPLTLPKNMILSKSWLTANVLTVAR